MITNQRLAEIEQQFNPAAPNVGSCPWAYTELLAIVRELQTHRSQMSASKMIVGNASTIQKYT